MFFKLKSGIFFILLFLYSFNIYCQDLSLDSLEATLRTISSDKERIDVLILLSDEYNFTNAEKARQYGYEGVLLSKRLNNTRSEAAFLRNIGVAHQGQGNYDSALFYQKESLEKWKALKDSVEMAGTINNIGIIYDEKGDNQKAAELYLKSARLYERVRDIDGLAKVYNNLGIILKKTKQFKKALEYYQKALEMYELKNNRFGIAVMYSNIGSLHLDLKEYKECLENSYIAVEKYKEINVMQYLPYAYENLALAYSALDMPDSSASYYYKALELYSSYGNQKQSASALKNLAKYSLNKGDLQKALFYADSCLTLSSKIGAKEEKSEVLHTLALIHKNNSNFFLAYSFLNEYVLLKDSIDNYEKSKIITELETQYETEKKEQEIKILQAETLVKDLKISSSESKFLALAVISGLVLIIGGLVFNSRELKQKQILAEEREKQQKLQLIAMVEAEENERKRIARELHDGVGQQLSGIKMAFETLLPEVITKSPQLTNKMNDLTKYLYESSDEIRNISHQMMPLSLTRLGLVPAIHDLMEKTFKYSKITPTFDQYKADQRFPENIEIALYRVIQELLNNVIKHSAASEVGILIMRNNNKLVVTVEDNGIGVKNTSTEGHGLYNIKNRLEAINGKAHFEENSTGGTITTVTVALDEGI